MITYLLIFPAAVMILMSSSLRSSADEPPLSSGGYFKKSLNCIKSEIPDSAMYYLQKSFSMGLPDDSLYYLWSRILIKKGKLDTALALNFASSPAHESALYTRVLEQRRSIYLMLGWKEEALRISDSLFKIPSNRFRKLIPYAGISLGGGGYSEKEIEKNTPFNEDEVVRSYSSKQINYSGYLRWNFPLSSSQGLKADIQYTGLGLHFIEPLTSSNLTDSLDRTFSAGLRYYLLSERISFGYGWSRKQDLYNSSFVFHKFDMRFFLMKKLWSMFLECGYNLETREPGNNFYGFFFLDRSFSDKNGLSFSLNFLHHSAEPLQGPDTNKVNIRYVDGFQFYSDSSFTGTFTTPVNVYSLLQGNPQPTMFNVKLPMSYINLNPSVSLRHGLWWNMACGIGAGYILTKYIGDYVWVDYRYSKEKIQNEFVSLRDYGIMVMNRSDRKKYWLRDIDYVNREITLDTLPVVTRSRTRIDNTFTLNVYLKKRFGRIAEICLSGDISRNFSNMEHETPVEIPRSFRQVHALFWVDV